MESSLSSLELRDNLEILRGILQDFDFSKLKNVIFFSIESFYAFLSKDCPDINVDEILERIQPFIPLAVNDDNLDLFLQAGRAEDLQLMDELEQRFINKSKIDFINIVRNAQSKSEWNNVLNLCETIRDYKESCVSFQ